ncbi:MAG: serine dehydratase beta chain, partial [Pseudomonadota bacterium]
MFLSIFEIFKIGVGPSSSHTMGPMVAAARFLDVIRANDNPIPGAGDPAHVSCSLHGSLAFTGKGHASDRAVILGLQGYTPSTVDPDDMDAIEAGVRERCRVTPEALPELAFDPDADLVMDFGPPLPGHANGMIFRCRDAEGNLRFEETYYSIGGGFVQTERERKADTSQSDTSSSEGAAPRPATDVPYPFASAEEMLSMGRDSGLDIAAMKRANEVARGRDIDQVRGALADITDAMHGCIDRGLRVDGILPGGLGVKRRAKAIYEKLQDERGLNT